MAVPGGFGLLSLEPVGPLKLDAQEVGRRLQAVVARRLQAAFRRLRRPPAGDFSLLGTQKTPIEKTEFRGITLPQLEQLDDFIDRHADEHGVLHGWLDREGQPLHKNRINLYDVVKYVVKPATKEHKCSYVELVAPAGSSSQKPKWFVSHWWGEPVKDFIKALKNHATVRGLKKTDAYWVCAYATDC